MIKKSKRSVIVVMFLFLLLFNILILLGNRNVKAITWLDALRYCAACINIGCTSGPKKCAEFHPDANTTVTCYEPLSSE